MEILKDIKNEKQDLSVLMLSTHSEKQYARRALRSGASGYLVKESAPDELIDAIRRVSQGLKYITPSLAEHLASEIIIGRDKSPHEYLSDREFQVMVKIANGNTVKEIAEKLFLSAKTISTYRTRILEKMDMKNNSDITRYAIENNLMDTH